MLMLNRAFFSLQENWIPTAVALGNLFLNAILDFAFYRYGTWGIPLSTAIVNIAGTAALLVADAAAARRDRGRQTTLSAAIGSPRRLRGRRGDRLRRLEPLDSAARAVVPRPGRLARARPWGATGIYAGACRFLQVRELDSLIGLIRRRATG